MDIYKKSVVKNSCLIHVANVCIIQRNLNVKFLKDPLAKISSGTVHLSMCIVYSSSFTSYNLYNDVHTLTASFSIIKTCNMCIHI